MIGCVTRPFRHSPTEPAVATNKDAAATACIRGMQAVLARELDSYRIHDDILGKGTVEWRNKV